MYMPCVSSRNLIFSDFLYLQIYQFNIFNLDNFLHPFILLRNHIVLLFFSLCIMYFATIGETTDRYHVDLIFKNNSYITRTGIVM